MNGSEIITGDSIIMPIDISTEAITMSITKNGMKIMKAIWNAVLSSLVTNAGTTTVNGISSGFSAAGRLASLANKARSGSRTCFNMKVLTGTWARVSASLKLIWLVL